MKKPFHRIFVFTKMEQRGLIVLLLLCFGIVMGRHLWMNQQIEVEWMPYQDSTMLSFLAGLEEKTIAVELPEYTGPAVDLNKATEPDLLKLGFSSSLAKRFLRYRSAGGQFFSSEEVMRVYGMDDKLWNQIAPHVYFPERSQKNAQKTSEEFPSPDNQYANNQYKIERPVKVALNRADTFELMQLPGIGRVFAERILGYRDLLGGYTATLQLLEVYGMTEERFKQCSSYVSVDTLNLRKLSLNSADFSTLLRHPYLNRKQVQTLMAYRQYTDSSITFQGLIDNRVLDTAQMRKLSPYLSFDK